VVTKKQRPSPHSVLGMKNSILPPPPPPPASSGGAGEDSSITTTIIILRFGIPDGYKWLSTPPIPNGSESLRLRIVEWRDQGWGNRKGAYGQINESPSVQCEWCSSVGGTSTHNFNMKTDHLSGLLITIDLKPLSSYRIHYWYSVARGGDWMEVMLHVGGGGGHELFIETF